MAMDSTGSGFYFEGVMGQSMDKIYNLVEKVAALPTCVLIMGESGTGKETIARAIHSNGPRRDRPFVLVNCGGIPEDLADSELFGHARGAFTGAISVREGLFKQADGGTIFLNSVEELPANLQGKLLQVLKRKIVTPIGGTDDVKVDVRVISASTKNLENRMEKGQFRKDLYYRLGVVEITLPPLHSRKEDIPQLTTFFIRKYAEALGKEVWEFTSDVLTCLMDYSYTGNIGELESIVEHAVALTDKNIIGIEDLPPSVRGIKYQEEARILEETSQENRESLLTRGSLEEDLAIHERSLLLAALKKTNGVQKEAAKLLGINYRSFRHRSEKYGLLESYNEED